MADCRNAKNKEIVALVREKLYIIINAHVMDGDDECAAEHLKFFMEGFCWRTNIDYEVRENGDVMLFLLYQYTYHDGRTPVIFKRPYFLLNIDMELKTLRKSINRHYHKNGGIF